jgi:DNA-binding IclR family transcriptional regulator
MTLTELTNKTEYTKSNMLRILATLESENFITYNEETKKYSLGFMIHKLSDVAPNIDVKKICKPFFIKLSLKSRCLIHLSAIKEDKIIVIDRFFPNESSSTLALDSIIGGSVPLNCTGAGKVLYAFSDQDTQKALIENCTFESFSETTITDKDEFIKVCNQVREDRYAINKGEHESFLSCLTSPILDSENKIVAAFSFSLLNEVFTDKKLYQLMELAKEARIALSNLFGYKGEIL